MSDQPFRFLHSADFRLDQPLYGLTEIPDHLHSALIDGAYRSAERVFDTAISEKVAFVCLTGNLLNLALPTARSISFLRDQFERLGERGIAVYWSGSHQDTAHHWPALITLPDSIHRFGPSAVETTTHEEPTGFLVDVLGQSGTREVSVAEFCACERPLLGGCRDGPSGRPATGHAEHRLLGVGWSDRPQDAFHRAECGALPGHAARPLSAKHWPSRVHCGRGAGHRVIPACVLCRVTSFAGSTNGS